MASSYKPVGGVKRVLLYPTEAIKKVLFSKKGCEVEYSAAPIEVELMEDKSSFEERAEAVKGQTRITHILQLVSDRAKGEEWLKPDFLEMISIDGAVADVELADNRHLLVGYSTTFGNEQPLRLESLSSSSGSTLHDKPTLTLRLVSHDIAFSCEIVTSNSY